MNTALALNNYDMWTNESKLKEIRRMICPSTPLTDLEFSFLVELGRATGLNPFMRELWAVKYKQGVPASIFLGRDGYRKAAQRQADYEYHQVNAVYSKDEFRITSDEIQHNYGFSNRGDLIGAYCIVKRKSSSRYTYVMVTMEEYNLRQSLWKDKPETMIKKVAEAQALRQSFQEVLAGTYSDAELPQEASRPLKLIGGTQTEKLNNLLKGQNIDLVLENSENPGTVTPEQLAKIYDIMTDKNFDDGRKDKAIAYALKMFRVAYLEELSTTEAEKFILQLEKA